MTQIIDAREFAQTLTGFDELAIKKFFRDTFENLDGMLAPRSLIFVLFRREGNTDGDAYTRSMNLTIGQVDTYFVTGEDSEGESDGSTKIEPTQDS
jgi:hypothetical protein